MLELKYNGSKITATLNGVTALVKEPDQEIGDWTLNIVKNFLASFGVTYTEAGVVYNEDAVTYLYVERVEDTMLVSNMPLAGQPCLSLETSPELEEILNRLGAIAC